MGSFSLFVWISVNFWFLTSLRFSPWIVSVFICITISVCGLLSNSAGHLHEYFSHFPSVSLPVAALNYRPLWFSVHDFSLSNLWIVVSVSLGYTCRPVHFFFFYLSIHVWHWWQCLSVSGYGHGESWAVPPPLPIPSVCPSLSMYQCNSETPCLSRSSRTLLNVCVGWLVGLQVPVVAPLPPSLCLGV